MDRDSDQNSWELVLEKVRAEVDAEDFHRWFASTSYAGDSGDQINVWIGSDAIRRHIETHYQEEIDRALTALNRSDTLIRFIVAGFGDEDDEEKEDL